MTWSAIFSIESNREQILDLLVSTFEDIVLKNRELKASQAELARAKASLQDRADRD